MRAKIVTNIDRKLVWNCADHLATNFLVVGYQRARFADSTLRCARWRRLADTGSRRLVSRYSNFRRLPAVTGGHRTGVRCVATASKA